MKILWHSANPTIPSGYGVSTKLLVPALARQHEVVISCHAGLFGAVQVWNGIRMLPHSNYPAQYGMDLIEHHAAHFHPDVCISWLDAFVLQPAKIKPLPWCAWVPVDSWPLMKQNIEPLKACRWIVAPTQWGKTAIEKVGLKVDEVIPCPFDPQKFFPMDATMAQRRADLSRVLGTEIGDKFLVNVVSANAGKRKNFEAILTAWGLFHKQCPESLLFLHTDPTGYFFQGENLNDMAVALGVDSESVLFPAQWEYVVGAIGEDFLNLLYNCSDLHLNCCHGEGFGIPILEAQAAGCPALTPAFGAAKEINKMKMLLDGDPFYGVPGGLQFAVDAHKLVEQLFHFSSRLEKRILRDPAWRRQVSAAVNEFSVATVAEQWLKFLKRSI